VDKTNQVQQHVSCELKEVWEGYLATQGSVEGRQTT